MKRQHNVLEKLLKIPRTESFKQDPREAVTQTTLMNGSNLISVYNTLPTRDEEDAASALPDCWSMKQYKDFKKKYNGLIVRNKKLGCDHCAKFDSTYKSVKGIHISMEWGSCSIEASGRDKTIQQASLRKKMNEHFSSKAHGICVKQLQDHADEAVVKYTDIMIQKHTSSACRVFNTVYSLAKRSRPFSDIEDEIELQIKNGVDMGAGRYSWKTTVRIVDHIAKEIKNAIFTEILKQNLKISVIVDEVSNLFSKPVLIIFVKIEDWDLSPTIFLDLVELEGYEVETICTSLLKSLHNAGFDSEYLRSNFIAYCSDGASAMLGCTSLVGTRLKNDYPNIAVAPWQTAEEKLSELSEVFHHEISVNEFRDYMENMLQNLGDHAIPQFVKKAKNVINTIAANFAEVDRDFSRMNIIHLDERSHLTVENVGNLMTINLIGLPLNSWDATPSVKTWLRKNNVSDDNRVKQKKVKDYDDNQEAIWRLLK